MLRDPKWLGDFWRMRIGALNHEVFAVAYLDSAHRLLRNGVETLQGTMGIIGEMSDSEALAA